MFKLFENNSEEIKYNSEVKKKLDRYINNNDSAICTHKNCKDKSIKAHAISNKSSLSLIAENGELMHPKSIMNGLDKHFEFRTVGVNSATVFSGFCDAHDKMFSRLDSGLMESKHDLFMQCYRTVSHAIYFEGLIYRYMSAEEKHSMRDKIEERIRNQLENSKPKDYQEFFYKMYKEYEEVLWYKRSEKMRRFQKVRHELLEIIESNETLDEPINDFAAIWFGSLLSDIFYKKITFQIPVAMSSYVTVLTESGEVDLFFSVIPKENTTELIVLCSEGQKLNLDKYFTEICKSNIFLLNFVELLMLKTEQWYIKPSIINNKNKHVIQAIQEDIYCNNEFEIFNEYDISIFDELRLQLIQNEDERLVKYEMKKIGNIPERKNFETRRKETNLKVKRDFNKIV